MPPAMLKIEEVAKILQVEPRTVRTFCTRGELEFVRLGRKTLRFKPEWIDDFIARKQRGRKADAVEKRRRQALHAEDVSAHTTV